MAGKMISLVVDMTSVFCVSVLTSVSLVLFGSTFNSWHMAVHMVVMYVPSTIALTLINVHLRSKSKKIRRKRKSRVTITKMKTLGTRGNTNATSSVMPSNFESVVMQSDV